MKVRRAAERDIPRIAELLLQVGGVHAAGRPDLFKRNARKYTDEELTSILRDDKRPVFVAEDERGEVLGYAFTADATHLHDNILTPVRILYVDDICVDENARGRGVGRTLYEFVRAWAKEQGYYALTLNVWSCNPDAMKFYIAMGLVPYKVGMECILSDGDDGENI